MRLNSQKTLSSNNVVKSSIKPDKLYWNSAKQGAKFLPNHLLLIHELAKKFPNSGSLNKALTKFFNRIYKYKEIKGNTNVLNSIIVDIAYKNPRTYPIISAILSEFLAFSETDTERDEILKKIENKFKLIPNIGHLQIWLQRITITFDKNKSYSEKLCKKVYNSSIKLWNVEWLNSDSQNLINNEIIVDETIIEELKPIIEPTEVQLFGTKTDYY